MTVIRESNQLCTVIVTVDAASEVIAQMEPHARDGLKHFATMRGFVSGALHESDDGQRLVQYLQWESEADHRACMEDPRWDELPSTREFMSPIEAGQATIDVRTYTVIAASSSASGSAVSG